jgi:hypothetical protein
MKFILTLCHGLSYASAYTSGVNFSLNIFFSGEINMIGHTKYFVNFLDFSTGPSLSKSCKKSKKLKLVQMHPYYV